MTYVIVPAYNEEEKIGRVIRGLFEQGYKNIIVVDDGSTDRTSEIAIEEGALVLRHETNRGQGAALQTGNEYALGENAEIVVHFDADGQFNPTDILPAIEKLKDFDVVLGSRFLDSRSKIPWLKRHIILPVSRWINFALTRLKLSDVHNGFRVLTRNALEKLTITHDGMAHNSEIIAQIKKNNLKFVEHPVEVTYHEYGQGVGGGVKIILDLIVSKF